MLGTHLHYGYNGASSILIKPIPMKDYKDTLNLPKTDFPMKANLAQREPQILDSWKAQGLYERMREYAQGRPKFILHDGPPYANARPHLGTALNKILKDMVLKSKTLEGFDTPFIPGWDCHGLPIELNVEKKLGKAGDKVTNAEFRKACREYAGSQVTLQKGDFERLGVIADWDHPYLTMNRDYEANTVRALARIIENGHLQRGHKPVHWCIDCASALAEAEVEYQDKTSTAIDVAFMAQTPSLILSRFGLEASSISEIIVPIWTTTPWTLPANQAVAVNAKLYYVLVKVQLAGHEKYLVIAEELLSSVLERYQVTEHETLAAVEGALLEHLLLHHPFADRVVPIILAEHVTTDGGTGNVHTAPAHGQDDYLVGQVYGLDSVSPVNSKSCFVSGTPWVSDQHVFKANPIIVENLEKTGHLLHQAPIHHSYPHCWRHKTPLIFRATPQWFIGMDRSGLRAKALESIKSVEWLPDWGQLRINNMIAQRPDWCISRQRAWGAPLPFFVHHETGELHPQTPGFLEKIAKLMEAGGLEAWYELDPVELLGSDAEDYEKLLDVQDVWFDSGVSHFTVLERHAGMHPPADLYLEGSDQHRGWFQTSLLSSLAIRNETPFKAVLTHGYVVDAKGKKMSKSIGNTIAPSDVVQQMGADVLRLWVCSSDYRDDISVSTEILNRSADAYRRLRNTARFLLSNLSDFDPAVDLVAAQELLALDYWAIEAAQQLQSKIIEAYQTYQFQHIYQLIHNFCTVEMGSFYLDIIKDRQYTTRSTGLPRRSAQTAMFYILEALVRWLAPITSFTAEEIWRHMPGTRAESVFLTEWYQAWPSEVAGQRIESSYWAWFMEVRSEVNKALESKRNAGLIGSALEAEVVLYAESDLYAELSVLGDELRFALITSSARVLPEGERDSEAEPTGITGLWVSVKRLEAAKCVRCWQHRPDVGTHSDDPGLCGRCVENVVGEGENRCFA